MESAGRPSRLSEEETPIRCPPAYLPFVGIVPFFGYRKGMKTDRGRFREASFGSEEAVSLPPFRSTRRGAMLFVVFSGRNGRCLWNGIESRRCDRNVWGESQDAGASYRAGLFVAAVPSCFRYSSKNVVILSNGIVRS